jgi:hypothetical protein
VIKQASLRVLEGAKHNFDTLHRQTVRLRSSDFRDGPNSVGAAVDALEMCGMELVQGLNSVFDAVIVRRLRRSSSAM